MTGAQRSWVRQGRRQMRREAGSLDPNPRPTLPTRVQCWASRSLPLTGAWRSQFGGKHRAPRSSATKVAHTDPSTSIPWLYRLCPVGPGPQANGKVHAGAYDLVSPIPVGTKPRCRPAESAGGGPEGPAEQGPHPKPPTSQLGTHTAPKPGPARLCRAHPHAHAHTGTPLLPSPRLSTYLRRRPEDSGPARASRFSPHPAAVESHGPPPAPITKQHNNRLSEFR